MADYGVNIKVAVQNSQKIQQLTRQLKTAGNEVDKQNTKLATMAGVTEKVISTVGNLNRTLLQARSNFNKAVLGTQDFITNSKNLIATNREVTRSLEQRAAALKRIESGQALGPTLMGSASSQRQSQFAKLEQVRKRALTEQNRDFQQQVAEQFDLERTKARKSLEIKKRAAEFRLEKAKKERALEENLQRIGAARNKQQSDRARVQEALGKMEARSEKIDKNRALLQQKSLRLGNQIVKTTTNEVLANKKNTDEQEKQLQLEREQARLASRQAKLQKSQARSQAMRGAASSALIGGGFPLLFGQGGAAATGGAIGGLAGGAIGGGFGFALSIIGTAIGQALEDAENFDRSLNELNATLSTSGTVSITTAADVRALASELNIAKEEATELLGTFSGFGDGDVREELARVFEPVGGRKTLNLLGQARLGEEETLEAINALSEIITLEKAEELKNQLKTNGALAAAALLQEAVLERSQNITKESERAVGAMDRLKSLFATIAFGYSSALYGPLGATEPPMSAEEMAEQRAAGIEPPDQSIVNTVLQQLEQFYKQDAALRERYSKGSGIDPTINLKKRLGILNKQIEAEEKVVGLSSEGAGIVRRKLAFEKRIAQIQEAGKAERERLTDLEDISLSNTIQARAEKLATLQFEREIAVAVERSATASEKTLEPVQKKLDALKDRNAFEREYGELIMSGSTTAAAKQVIEAKKQVKEIDDLVEKQVRSNDLQISILRVIVAQTIGTDAHTAAQEALNEALERENEIREKGKKAKAEVKGEKTPAQTIEEEIKRVQGALNDLIDPANQVILAAQAIGDAFSESFKGLIRGSMSAQEALANLFQRTADHFADMAAEIIAKQIQMKILGIALNFFGGGGARLGGAETAGTGGFRIPEAAAPKTSGMNFGTFATGGYVSGPTNALIGEGGQPEYVIPASKMTEAMGRYARGARGAAVIPEGDGASTEGGMGGGFNVVDVRYSVERINNVDYVTAAEFERGMNQAAKRGAELGRQGVYSDLVNKRSVRSRVGV